MEWILGDTSAIVADEEVDRSFVGFRIITYIDFVFTPTPIVVVLVEVVVIEVVIEIAIQIRRTFGNSTADLGGLGPHHLELCDEKIGMRSASNGGSSDQ